MIAGRCISLRRLRTDHLDLLWLHTWDFLTPVDEVLRALDDVVAARARCSTSESPTLRRGSWPTAAGRAPRLDPLHRLQIQYSLAERTPRATCSRWPRRSP